MLTSGARRALIGLGVLAVLAALFFALRGGEREPEPRASPSEARVSRKAAPADTPVAPRAPRTARPRSALRPPSKPSAKPAEVEAPALRPGEVSDPALKSVLAARDDRSAEGTRTLIDNLTSKDDVVVAEATRALIARQATEAIAPLAAIRLEDAAGSGLSVIDALGKLGGVAEGDDRSSAVDRLLEMLREEKRRAARESPGNLLQIYEALGDTLDPRAASALEAELLDASVPRAPKVVIVQALVDIGLPSSKDAIRTELGEQSAQQGSDAFEEEIRQELVATLEDALERL